MSGTDLFAALYIVNALIALGGLIAVEVFLRSLRVCAPEVHRELGEPSVFANNTGLNTIRAVGFLLFRKHRVLPDRRARRLGDIAFAVLVSSLVTGGIAAVCFSIYLGRPSI